MSLDNATRERIETLLKDHRVVLFMKGDRQQPMCGFSAAATNMLNELLPDYHTINVLEDPEIREGIKAYGEWPTIPQLYVEGELVGGADIIRQLYTSGELHELFGAAPDRTPPESPSPMQPPRRSARVPPMRRAWHCILRSAPITAPAFSWPRLAITTSSRTATGLKSISTRQRAARQRHRDRLGVYRAGRRPEPEISRRAGNQIPHRAELKARLAADNITLIDVRPAHGRAQARHLPQARVLEEEGYESLAALPKDTALAFICHHGISSRGMAERFAAHGFSDVHNVEGGMDAWATEIDSSVPRY
jgi:monothiol glutaredoxin